LQKAIYPLIAFDVGWKIGRTIDTKWLHLQDPQCIIFGCPAQPSGSPVLNHAFPNTFLWTSGLHTLFPTAPFSTGQIVWDYAIGDSFTPNGAGWQDVTAFGTDHYNGAYFIQPGETMTSCGTTCDATLLRVYNIDMPVYAMSAGTAGFTYYAGTDCTPLKAGTLYTGGTLGGGSHVATCGNYFAPATGNKSLASLEASPPQPWVAQPADATTTMSPSPSPALTASQLATLRASLTAASDPSLIQEINCLLDPNDYVCPSGPTVGDGTTKTTSTLAPAFVLPQPSPDDTYITYTERLRTLGYLGSVTVTDDAMSEYPFASYGARLLPQSLTSIQVGTATTIYLYNQTTGVQTAWPTSPDLVTPGVTTSIHLARVPIAYDPLTHGATTGTETGAGGVPGTTGACHCPPFDLTPLESISLGTKFPFGIYTWLTTGLGTIPTSGAPLTFVVTKPDSSTVSVSTASSEWESTVRPIVFPIVEFLITLSMFFVFATKIIGLGGWD
jgi:hypothetical protein